MGVLAETISADVIQDLVARGAVLVIHSGPWAFAFEDDGEVWLNAYLRTGDSYERMFEQMDAGPPGSTPPYHGGWNLVPALGTGFAWLLGRTDRPAVTIHYLGETHDISPDANGYWAFIREMPMQGPDGRHDLPAVAPG